MKKRIIGAKGGGKGGGGGSARVPVEYPDSLRSRQVARVIDALCEGPIGGLVDGLKSIYLDGTPVQNPDGTYNYQGVAYDHRVGSQADTYMPGLPASESEKAVGVEIKDTQSHSITVTNQNVNAVRVTLGFPGLSYQDSTTGDLSGAAVRIAVDVQTNGGGYVERFQDVISGKTMSRYQRAYVVGLSGSQPWDIRVRRVSPNATVANIQDKSWWDSYTEIIDSKLAYPNTAKVLLVVDAAQFSTVPARAYDCKLQLVNIPNNYDPVARTYTGEWNGTFSAGQWTDNPAWCFYDLITNDRYGLGEFIDAANVDKWALYKIAQYCDVLVDNGRGGQEPRFTCNLLINTREEAQRVVTHFASLFQAMAFWAGNQLTVVQDAPADPVAVFAEANVINGEFNYEGSALRSRHTVALVAWNDPSDGYRQKIEYVEIADAVARYGVRPVEVVAFGCTSRGQAHRTGKAILYAEYRECEVISFACGADGFGLYPGAIFQTSDAHRAGVRWAGRVIEAPNLISPDLETWTKHANLDRTCQFKTDPDGGMVWRLKDISATEHTNVHTGTVGGVPVQGAYYQARYWVLKTTGAPASFAGLRLEFTGGTTKAYEANINPQTGAIYCRGSAAGGVGVTVEDRGDFWLLRIIGTPNAENVTAVRAIVYAALTTTISGAYDVATQGWIDLGSVKIQRVDSITLDSEVAVSAGGDYVSISMPDGSIKRVQVWNGNGTASWLLVGNVLGDVPQEGAMWLYETMSLLPEKWRCISVVEEDGGATYKVVGISHLDSKYLEIESDIVLEDPPSSLLSSRSQSPPTDIAATEYLAIRSSQVRTFVTISWTPPVGAVRYIVEARRGTLNWAVLDSNERATSYDYEVIDGETYLFRVTAVSVLGVLSTPAVSSPIQILGKRAPPPDLTTFLVARQSDGTRQFTWAMSDPPLDYAGVMIRYRLGSGWTWDQMSPLHDGVLTLSPWETNQLAAGAYTFAIKAVDTTGNLSQNALFISGTLGDPRLSGVLLSFYDSSLLWASVTGGTVTLTNCHLEPETGWLRPNEAMTNPWVQDWDGAKWINTEATSMSFQRQVDIGAVVTFTPIVSADADGTLAIEEQHSTDGSVWSNWATTGSLITARHIRYRVTLTGSAKILRDVVCHLSATTVTEVINDWETNTASGSYRIGVGDVRLPKQKTYAVITSVNVVLQGTGSGWSWKLIDKQTTYGPRIQIYNGANLADCKIDAEIKGQ